ncbi:CBS domain-containing protein [Alkalilimnicola ehrlichii MLHE-1]|uniref:Putative signal-transduction protein with CBS domains n=1 Tax=Alkalilimnicola ehrlichii (strain ATCC BAA-1101 / DSM 17681 / MLHE-1) TaxID=187272 RepID=Q0A9B8_ALKEH|nr:CBS domain-containing protein [Alkalilimnicola ehrlichii]ABI56569.1 putative signal-transduction protein with CBS domains [Alkalilimnicola ehrlichii MLHE-1]
MENTLHAVLKDKGVALYSVDADVPVAEAIKTMADGHVGCVLVMEKGSLRGIFTERDVMIRVVHDGKDPAQTPVSEVMTREVAVVPPTMTVEEAMVVCLERRVRHLPVYDGSDLEGVVSSGDLMRWVIGDQKHMIDDLIQYIYIGR